MPWHQTDRVKERLQFVVQVQQRVFTTSELCERYGVSRETGYRLLRRYEQEGVDGLKDRSHAPKHCPHRIGEEIQALLLASRRAHPKWGPRTILEVVGRDRPGLALPAASTVGDLFSRAGLIERRRRQRRWRHPGRTVVPVRAANDLWTTDYKGEFRLRDGTLCYPLTIADASTRFLLACEGLSSTAYGQARAVFERVFRSYGLPRAIRSDNGPPFATKAVAGLSRLSVWWTKIGIQHDRIAPGHPEQNGSHERMHKTLGQMAVRPASTDGQVQQERFDAFRAEYDWVRPHHALGMQTPGSLYSASERELPPRLPAPEYAGHYTVRQVRANGIFNFRDRGFFLSELLAGERIALEEIEDGVWSIYFYDLLLARLDVRTGRISG